MAAENTMMLYRHCNIARAQGVHSSIPLLCTLVSGKQELVHKAEQGSQAEEGDCKQSLLV